MRKPKVSYHRHVGVGFLYAIRSGDYIKIGLSTKFARRFKELSIGNPHPMRVEMCRTVDREFLYVIEKEIHRVLAEQHHQGEWFLASGAQVKSAVAKALRRANALAGRDIRILGACRKIGFGGQRVYLNDETGEDFAII